MKQFMAVFTGSGTSPNMKQWEALEESTRKAKEQEGIKAWGAWMAQNKQNIVFMGSPLGKTKLIDAKGISDSKNNLSAFVVVQAESHGAAAEMFVKHPHFSIFPGDGVEVMECLPVPGM
jgi:hypothetical protein